MGIASFFSGGLSSVVDSIGGIADRFIETPDEKSAFKLEVETLLQKRDSEIEQTIRAELSAKEKVLVAELNQGDNYTKRARPTVVYAGLIFIGINYVIFPVVGRVMGLMEVTVSTEPLADLPVEFWAAWGGICATWSIGRSAEKRGNRGGVVSAITGNKSRLLD
tara:strand:- start:828 stop:1319 length:492 start_codon:yes stop_codon:yes gene_type:complete